MARNPEMWKRQRAVQEIVTEEVEVTFTPSKAPPTKVSRTVVAPVVTKTVGSGTVTTTLTPTSDAFSTQPIFDPQTTANTFLTTTTSSSSATSIPPSTTTGCDSAHTLCPAPHHRTLAPAIIAAIAATVSAAVLILLGIGFVTYRRVHRRAPPSWPEPATVNGYDPNGPAPLHRLYEPVRSEVSSPSPGPTPPAVAVEQGFDFGFGTEVKEGGVVQLAEADSGQETRVYEIDGAERSEKSEKRWSDGLWKKWRRSGGSS